MAKNYVPDFASIIASRPVAPPSSTGMVVASAASQALLNLSLSANQNSQAKKSLNGFADSMEATNPQAAAQYRSMATSIPAFDVAAISGGGVDGGGSGGGGGGSSLPVNGVMAMGMKDMFDAMKTGRDQNAAISIDNARTQNDSYLKQLSSQLNLVEMSRQAGLQSGLQDKKGEVQANILALKDRLAQATDARAKEKLQLEIDRQETYIQQVITPQIENTREGNRIRAAENLTDLMRLAKGDTSGGRSGTSMSESAVLSRIYSDPGMAGEYMGLKNAYETIPSGKDYAEEKAAAKARVSAMENSVRANIGSGLPVPTTSLDRALDGLELDGASISP